VLVLSPTRELAIQTENTVTAIGDFMNVHAHACVGGKSMGKPGPMGDDEGNGNDHDSDVSAWNRFVASVE